MSSDDLPVLLLFVAVGVLACLAPAQSDTWWLLRGGEQIWREHRIPLADSSSHTAGGAFWPNHEWLTEALFYAAYRAGGMPVVAGLCAAAITTAWAIAWRLGRAPYETKFALFGLSMFGSAGAWALRPQVFTLAAFAAVSWLLASGRLYWIPVVCLIWANLHGAVALGLAAIGGAAVAEAAGERRLPWALLLCWVLSAASTFVTPLGARLWTFIPDSIARSHENQLIEWRAPGLGPQTWVFWLVAGLLCIAVVWGWARADRWTRRLSGVALAMLPLALGAVRNVPVFLLAAAPATAALSVAVLRGQQSARLPTPGRRRPAAVIAVVGAGAAIVAAIWARPIARLGWTPMSTAAARAIEACPETLYNAYDTGGVLIWFVRSKRVFIDNRQDPYGPEFLADADRVERGGDVQPLFDRYGVRCAALAPTSPTALMLTAYGWATTYRDSQWVVWTRDE